MNRGSLTSALVVFLGATPWLGACSPQANSTASNGGGGRSGGAGSASIAGSDASGSGGSSGTDGTSSSGSGNSGGSGGSGTGGASSSGGGSSGGAGMTGAGGSVTATEVPGPKVTFTDFAVPTLTPPTVGSPGAICAGPDGRIWFLHQTTSPNGLGAVTVDGQNFGQLNIPTTNIGPVDIAPGPDGNVWYTKQQGIGKVPPAALPTNANALVTSGGFTEYDAPMGGATGGIVKGPDGNMWYTMPTPGMIAKITASGQSTTYPLPGTNRTPTGIAVGPDGGLWYTDTTANKIGRITTSGVITEYAIPTPASVPKAISSGPAGDGNMWFVEYDAHSIGRITPSGAMTEFAIPSGGRPYAITAGPDGNLWFTEPGAFNAIGRCTPSGGISEYPIPTPNTDVAGITVGPDGNIWFAEEFAGKVGRFSNLTGGGTLASATGPLVTTPLGGTIATCTKDTDCINSGMGCGGDVCSHAAATPACVLSSAGDPGWCTTSADCWCMSSGATCDTATHYCSSTM